MSMENRTTGTGTRLRTATDLLLGPLMGVHLVSWSFSLQIGVILITKLSLAQALATIVTTTLHGSDTDADTFATTASRITAGTNISKSVAFTTPDTGNHQTATYVDSRDSTTHMPVTATSGSDTTTGGRPSSAKQSTETEGTSSESMVYSFPAAGYSLTSSIGHLTVTSVSSRQVPTQNMTNTVITLTKHLTTTIRSLSFSDSFKSSVLAVTGSLSSTNSTCSRFSLSFRCPLVNLPLTITHRLYIHEFNEKSHSKFSSSQPILEFNKSYDCHVHHYVSD